MADRLILCLDGTWNSADSEDVTNIVHIRNLIDPKVKTSTGYEQQRVYYHDGVGTGLSKRDKIFGGATGLGLGHNVRSVYKFLSEYYLEGVEIYIFGFSRGAFTARSIAGYISSSGLLKPEHCSSENEERAWRFYRTSPDDRYPQEFEALRKFCYPNVRIRCVGIFDTVGALGVPLDMFGSWNRKRFQFHDVALGTNIDFGFHALAIDEKRGPFQASLWQYPNHRQFEHVEQVWFPGVHANIGGGYENRGLSDRALKWMLSRIERKGLGLKFITNWENTLAPNVAGTLYESRTPAYLYSRIKPMTRIINQRRPKGGTGARFSSLPRHAIPLGEMLDFSALWRWKESEGTHDVYRPVNLEAALDYTFSPATPYPIPIVGELGDPLDWVNKDEDLDVLKSFLPSQYQEACDQTVEAFRGNSEAKVFSWPYEQPRLPVLPA